MPLLPRALRAAPCAGPCAGPRAALRAGLLASLTALVASAALVAPGATAATSTRVSTSAAASAQVSERPHHDVRKSRGLFVDSRMPAAHQGAAYAGIGRTPQALWFSNEYYPTGKVQRVARTYTQAAEKKNKTPMLVVYSIPDRDCGQYSSGGLPGATAYKKWIDKLALGIKGSKSIVILEPDAIPFYGNPACENAGNRLGLMRYAAKKLTKSGAWVYLDAGHSDWTPYDGRAALLKRAGIGYARGFSTNVSNFRTTASETTYARFLLSELRKIGVTGKHYLIDTSRNGSASPVSNDVINPTWARIGKLPKLVFKGAFDGTLWVKHPGESDGPVNGGPSSGVWCDYLADRLLGRSPESPTC